MIKPPKTKVFDLSKCSPVSGLLVLSAGFEERSIEFISKINLDKESRVILVKFENDISDNKHIYKEYYNILANKIDESKLITVILRQDCPRDYSIDLEKSLEKLPREINNIWIDVSGMPSHAICASLQVLRSYKPAYPLNVIYTSAQSYHPSLDEFNKLKEKQNEGVEYLPASLAREMSENLILSKLVFFVCHYLK